MEPRNSPEENFGTLQGCLVEGDPEQRAREKSVRRRSLTISVLLQAAVLVAVVLIPLFARTERIALANVTPVPPYSPYREASHGQTESQGPKRSSLLHEYFLPNPHPTIGQHKPTTEEGQSDPGFQSLTGAGGENGLIDVIDTRAHKPQAPDVPPQTPHTLRLANIDPAMLRRKIDPIYPPLMKQIHREGRVEIHAFIGVDGTMQSLQVVGGDPLFYASALEAVQQWIYKPTILNGQPVQVDTTITVIYSLQH